MVLNSVHQNSHVDFFHQFSFYYLFFRKHTHGSRDCILIYVHMKKKCNSVLTGGFHPAWGLNLTLFVFLKAGKQSKLTSKCSDASSICNFLFDVSGTGYAVMKPFFHFTLNLELS